MISDGELAAISDDATERACRFKRESGNTKQSVSNRGHDIAIDLLLERGEDTRLYVISVTWHERVVAEGEWPVVTVTRKDAVTALGEAT